MLYTILPIIKSIIVHFLLLFTVFPPYIRFHLYVFLFIYVYNFVLVCVLFYSCNILCISCSYFVYCSIQPLATILQ